MGTYSGGGSYVLVGPDGTRWDGFDPADKNLEFERKRQSTTAKGQAIREAASTTTPPDDQAIRKAVRSFVSQCAYSYGDGTLSANSPMPPSILRKAIEIAGGNIRWLASDRRRQVMFHQSYCKKRGDPTIPFDRVWSAQVSATRP